MGKRHPCKIQAALVEDWCNTSLRFAAAIKAITGNHTATMCQADYMALCAKAEETRLEMENARMLLELHRKDHGC
jgi:hypothetical protein